MFSVTVIPVEKFSQPDRYEMNIFNIILPKVLRQILVKYAVNFGVAESIIGSM